MNGQSVNVKAVVSCRKCIIDSGSTGTNGKKKFSVVYRSSLLRCRGYYVKVGNCVAKKVTRRRN